MPNGCSCVTALQSQWSISCRKTRESATPATSFAFRYPNVPRISASCFTKTARWRVNKSRLSFYDPPPKRGRIFLCAESQDAPVVEHDLHGRDNALTVRLQIQLGVRVIHGR